MDFSGNVYKRGDVSKFGSFLPTLQVSPRSHSKTKDSNEEMRSHEIKHKKLETNNKRKKETKQKRKKTMKEKETRNGERNNQKRKKQPKKKE